MKFLLIYGLLMMGLLSPAEWLRYGQDAAATETVRNECLIKRIKAKNRSGNSCYVLLVIEYKKHMPTQGCIADNEIETYCTITSTEAGIATTITVLAVKPPDAHYPKDLPWKIIILRGR